MTAHIKLLDGATMPEYKSAQAAAFDLSSIETGIVIPGNSTSYRTGVIIKPPKGYFTMIAARSSLQKRGLMLANNVGIIDPDYCGPEDEIRLLLYNFGHRIAKITAGDRLAQAFFLPFAQATLVASDFEAPNRGGIGSTGL